MFLPKVSIYVSIFETFSTESFRSYTLSNTPFYVKLKWDDDTESKDFSQYQIIWNFDDGTTTIGPSAVHFYKFPGVYNIKATLFHKTGQSVTIAADNSLSAYNVIPDKIVFDRFTPTVREGLYLLPAGKKSEPLVIYRYNSWQHDTNLSRYNYTINLYASGSQSSWYSPESYYKNKYSHLRNFFGFVETTTIPPFQDPKIVDSTTTTSVSIYALPVFTEDGEINFEFSTSFKPGAAFAGTSGTSIKLDKVVRYIDQTPSKPGKNTLIFIQASQDSRGIEDSVTISKNLNSYLLPQDYGYNNLSWETQYLKSVFNPATTISITSNGITAEGSNDVAGNYDEEYLNSFNIYPIKWTGSNISFCCTFKDDQNFTVKNYNPIIKFRVDGQPPTEVNTVSLSLVKVLTPAIDTSMLNTRGPDRYNTERIEDAIFERNPSVPQFDNNCYFCGVVKTETTAIAAVISACALIQDQPILNLGITYGYAGQQGVNNLKRFSKKILLDHRNTETLNFKILDTETLNFDLDHNSSIGISVLPFGNYRNKENLIYVSDADNDKIKIYNSEGVLKNVIDFRRVFVATTDILPVTANLMGALDGSTPANIAFDSNGDAWISLYDAISCFKFDFNTLTVTACAVPPFLNNFLTTEDYNLQLGYAGENTLLPTCLDTDTKNNIFISYSHPLSNFIIKYNNSGQYLNHVLLPQKTTIQDIIVDANDNVYASVKDLRNNQANPHAIVDLVFKWSSELTLDNNFPVSAKNISQLTIDLNQNIYLNNDASTVTQVSPSGKVIEVNVDVIPDKLKTYEQYVGGIACDEEGFLWIINNQAGKIYFYPTESFYQRPLSEIDFGHLPDINISADASSDARYTVVGDWTGIRWINKYVRVITPEPRLIYGKSNLFSISKNKPVVSKVNENFDLAATLKGYVLQESLLNKPNLFDNFIGQIVGSAENSPTCLGKTIYEKIANFVSNKSDFYTCEIDSLKDLHNSIGKEFIQFIPSYPPELRRTMNLLSIKQSKLFGSPNTFNRKFVFNSAKQYNLGDRISVKDGVFTGGEPVIAYEKFSNQFKLIYNTLVPTTNNRICSAGLSYPLSGINADWGWGLVTDTYGEQIEQLYNFYKYLPYMPLTPTNNIIDFNDSNTTFTNTQSSYQNWTAYGGLMEKIISKALYEGLQL